MINPLDKQQAAQARDIWLKRVSDIASLLGAVPHPKYDANHWQRMYLTKDGFTLSFGNSQWRESERWNKLYISLTPDWGLMSAYHGVRTGSNAVTSMNVTLAKTDQQIVQEMDRRIVPGCRLLHEELLKAKAAAEDREQRERRWFSALAQHLEVKPYAYGGGERDRPNMVNFGGKSISLYTRNGYGSIEISTTDPDHALAIGRLVKEPSKKP